MRRLYPPVSQYVANLYRAGKRHLCLRRKSTNCLYVMPQRSAANAMSINGSRLMRSRLGFSTSCNLYWPTFQKVVKMLYFSKRSPRPPTRAFSGVWGSALDSHHPWWVGERTPQAAGSSNPPRRAVLYKRHTTRGSGWSRAGILGGVFASAPRTSQGSSPTS